MIKDDKKLHSGHRQRLREQFADADLTKMPEHQILELLLTYVQPYKDVNPIAHKLLNEFGSLANVFNAPVDELLKVQGMGEVSAHFINFCSKLPEIIKSNRRNTEEIIRTPKDAINYIIDNIDVSNIEKFYYMCISPAGKILCFKSMGNGTINNLSINNRQLVTEILKYSTDTIVICHTHPHGKPFPSQVDIDFTKNFENVLRALGIKLCDHIIISPDGYYSFFLDHKLGNIVNKTAEDYIEELRLSLSDRGFCFTSTKNRDKFSP